VLDVRNSEPHASADEVIEGVSITIVDGMIIQPFNWHFGGDWQFRYVFNEKTSESDFPGNCNVWMHRDSRGRPAECEVTLRAEVGFE
jgi:hypothetical protein